MADDSDDLVSRLDRIEALLRRRASASASVLAGPEVRSARSIVGRIDDVWVAVTEGNERVVAAIGEMTGASRPPTPPVSPGARNGQSPADDLPAGDSPAEAVDRAVAVALVDRIDAAIAGLAEERSAVDSELWARLAGIEQAVGAIMLREPPAARLDGIEAALAALAQPAGATSDGLGGRLDRIEERLGALATAGAGGDDRLSRIEDLLTPLAAAERAEVDSAVHLRLNRIEEALAGIAGRLSEAAADPDAAAGGQPQEAEIRRLTQQVEAIARAVEASAARAGDGTLTDRLGRLRDQFRPR